MRSFPTVKIAAIVALSSLSSFVAATDEHVKGKWGAVLDWSAIPIAGGGATTEGIFGMQAVGWPKSQDLGD